LQEIPSYTSIYEFKITIFHHFCVIPIKLANLIN